MWLVSDYIKAAKGKNILVVLFEFDWNVFRCCYILDKIEKNNPVRHYKTMPYVLLPKARHSNLPPLFPHFSLATHSPVLYQPRQPCMLLMFYLISSVCILALVLSSFCRNISSVLSYCVLLACILKSCKCDYWLCGWHEKSRAACSKLVCCAPEKQTYVARYRINSSFCFVLYTVTQWRGRAADVISAKCATEYCIWNSANIWSSAYLVSTDTIMEVRRSEHGPQHFPIWQVRI